MSNEDMETKKEKTPETVELHRDDGIEVSAAACEVQDTAGEKTMEEWLTAENEEILAENEELQKKCAKLEEEKTEITETLQRNQAEFENFRKRTIKEKEALRVNAAANLVAELLPVLDNFERALCTDQDDPLYQGMKMVQRQMMDILSQGGLTLIGSVGEAFDPQFHEAIAQEEQEGMATGTITEVLQPGYLFHEKLLRPAMVKVAK